MYLDNIALTAEDILQKEFNIDTKGYRMQEVDKFLDTVIKDYTVFYKAYKKLDEEKKELLEENMILKKEIRNLKAGMEAIRNSGNKEITNIDIIRRLSELEKIVYNNREE